MKGGDDDNNDDNYGVSKEASSSRSNFSSLVTTYLAVRRGGDDDYDYNDGVSKAFTLYFSVLSYLTVSAFTLVMISVLDMKGVRHDDYGDNNNDGGVSEVASFTSYFTSSSLVMMSVTARRIKTTKTMASSRRHIHSSPSPDLPPPLFQYLSLPPPLNPPPPW